MTLETSVVAILKEAAPNSSLDLSLVNIDHQRKQNELRCLQYDIPQVDVWKEERVAIDGPLEKIPLRIYRPSEAEHNKKLTMLVFYHGGGWVFGSLNMFDNFSRHLCKYGKTIVVSVGYRLAPEHKFPAAVDDSYTALEWVSENAFRLGGDVNKLCVGGDSAGGNLAAVMCHLVNSHNGQKLHRQLLFYPWLALHNNHGYRSRWTYGSGEYPLPTRVLNTLRDLYARSEKDYEDLRFSPILAESFESLPEALIIIPEYDPLRDEGEEYGKRMHKAGVSVDCRIYQGVTHGFVSQAGRVGVGLEALNDATLFLRKA